MQTPIAGLMMDFPLTTQHLLWRMENVFGQTEVLTVRNDLGATSTQTFTETARRARQLAAGLAQLGIEPGDKVGTFCWNHSEHLEAYYAVMGMGAVLHTINLRLHPDQIAWTIRHAHDRVLLVDGSMLSQITPLLADLPHVEHVIVIGHTSEDVSTLSVINYEDLISDSESHYQWPEIDEQSAASLCYTSGTTGDPKGVLYSHRALCLHALIMAGTETYRLGNADRVLSAVPMFHVMGWGLPFVCAIVGATLIMPNKFLQPEPLAKVIESQSVTWSAGVPTLWMDLLRHVKDPASASSPEGLKSLRLVLCGGAQVPVELMKEFEESLAVDVIQGWGMTEIFPGATVAHDPIGVGQTERWAIRSMTGRVSAFYEIRVVDDDGHIQPHDGQHQGEIEIRGPVVASAYYEPVTPATNAFHDGWLRTGDVGTVDENGRIRITDRAKDAIKSGGEWISSVDLEVALMEHPAVVEAAVVGRPDPRWSERPHAFVVTEGDIAGPDLKEFLVGRVAKWWIPDTIEFLDALPRTSTGKFDKKTLRVRLHDAAHPDTVDLEPASSTKGER